MDKTAPSIWMPALIGGSVFGFLSGLPWVGAINCACCALVIGAGVLASFLYSKECRKIDFPFRAGGGAKIGLVAGLFHGIVDTIMSAIVNRVTDSEAKIAEAIEQIQSNPQIPPEVADGIIRFIEMSAEGSIVFFLGFLGFLVIIGLIFGTIGGLIGGAVFKVEPQAPAQTVG